MEKKLRHSHQRDRIYEYLCSTKEHPSADMIYEALKDELPKLSLGTVYRNLKLLEDTGKIRRVGSLQSTERYDAHCETHAHFVCSCCGRVHDLKDLDITAASAGFAIPGRIDWMNVVFGGLCDDCRKQ